MSPHRKCKVDANQAEIVKALRQIGATVQDLSAVGKGCPDLLVGYRGRNYLMEIKDGEKCPSARKLTADQMRWHSDWHGYAYIVCDIEQALEILIPKE